MLFIVFCCFCTVFLSVLIVLNLHLDPLLPCRVHHEDKPVLLWARDCTALADLDRRKTFAQKLSDVHQLVTGAPDLFFLLIWFSVYGFWFSLETYFEHLSKSHLRELKSVIEERWAD